MVKYLTSELKKAEEKYFEAMDTLKYETPKRERALKLLQQAKKYGKVAGYNPTKQYQKLEKKYNVSVGAPEKSTETTRKRTSTKKPDTLRSDIKKVGNIHNKIIEKRLTPKQISSQLDIPEDRVRKAMSAHNTAVIEKQLAPKKKQKPITKQPTISKDQITRLKKEVEKDWIRYASDSATMRKDVMYGEARKKRETEFHQKFDHLTSIMKTEGIKPKITAWGIEYKKIHQPKPITDELTIGTPFPPKQEQKIKKQILSGLKKTHKKEYIKGPFYKGEHWSTGLEKITKDTDLYIEPVIKETKESRGRGLLQGMDFEVDHYRVRAQGQKYKVQRMKIPKQYEGEALKLLKTHAPENIDYIKKIKSSYKIKNKKVKNPLNL